MSSPQNNPRIKVGPFAQRPAPDTIPIGMLYIADDVPTISVVIGPGTPHTWEDFVAGGGGVAVPLNQIPYGTGPGVTSNPGFTLNPAFNLLTLTDNGLTATVFEAGGLVGLGRFANVKDENGREVLAIDALSTVSREVRIGDENGHRFMVVKTLAAEQTIRIGAPGDSNLFVDCVNRLVQMFNSGVVDVTWQINMSTGAPLTFLNIAAATASNGGIHGEGQGVFIQKVLKALEVPGNGSGALCYWSFNGPGGPGWYTGDDVIAAE